MNAPQLVFIGEEDSKLCYAKATSTKWCYDSSACSVRTHGKADKADIKPGLYVKSPGKRKLAKLLPHVPLDFVVGKGYAQEVMALSMSRTSFEWDLLFQVINMHSGSFESLADLDCEMMIVKANTDSFKTTRKTKPLLSDKSEEITDEDLLDQDDVDKPLDVQTAKLRKVIRRKMEERLGINMSQPMDDKAIESTFEELSGPLASDQDLLGQVVASLLVSGADIDSVKELQKSLENVEQDGLNTSAKVVELLTTIGSASNKSDGGASIYSELERLTTTVTGFTERLASLEASEQAHWEKHLEDYQGSKSAYALEKEKSIRLFRAVMAKQNKFESDLKALTSSIRSNVGTKIATAAATSSDPLDELLIDVTHTNAGCITSTMENPAPAGGTCGPSSSCGPNASCNCFERFAELDTKFANMEAELAALKLANDSTDEEVCKIGGFVFASRDNLLLWAREHLPAVIPFGCFVDVYTFLNRMLDSVGVSEKLLGNVVDQHRLGLGGDDAVTLESFQIPTPKLFGSANTASSLKAAHKSWIGTMPTADVWEDPRTSMGIRDRLNKQIPNIRAQIMQNINFKLSNHPVGRSLAMACLECTIAFINTLSVWISDTHLR